MHFKKISHLILLLLTLQVSFIVPLSQPIVKDGRYYHSASDTYEPIDLQRALKFLLRRALSLAQWKQLIVSFVNSNFSPAEKGKDEHLIPQPMQSIPKTSVIEPTITWIGHASFLIQINGFNILTDPIFGDVKAGPVTLTRRAMQPGVEFTKLPHIDAIIISHNHSDHTDTNSLMALQKKNNPAIFVPQGDKALFESMGFTRVIENMWWDKYKLTKEDKTLMFTFVPAYHWSIRFSLASYRKSLWGGWMISSNDTNLYFAGDTAYGPHFKEIAEQFPTIDAALLPIGPSGEKENEHKHLHVDAKEAVDAFIDLKARYFVPMHYGTFFHADHLKYPLPLLHKTWQEKQEMLQGKRLLLARCGEQYTLDKLSL